MASQLPDLMWNVFHYVGLEPASESHPMLVSVDNMDAVMTWSHDLVPGLLWMLPVVLVGRWLTGRWQVGLMGGLLLAGHVLVDMAAGYPHNLLGPDSPNVSTDMYRWAPYLAVGIEAVFTAGMLGWVAWRDRADGTRRTLREKFVWTGVFGGGLAFMALTADLTVAELLGVAPPPALDGLAMPFLTVNYVGMLLALIWAGRAAPAPAHRMAT